MKSTYFLFLIWVAWARYILAQVSDCKRPFVSDTSPGMHYTIYPLAYNGTPYKMPQTNLYDWISRLAYYDVPLYTGYTPDMNLNIILKVQPMNHNTVFSLEIISPLQISV